MKFALLFCFILFSNLHSKAQGKNDIAGFVGNWKGTLEWTRPGKSPQTFRMTLQVGKTDSVNQYSWTIIYGDSAKDIRPYTLKLVNPSTGHWVIDENNGIVLDNYLLSNCITGSFTVLENTITNLYCLENGKLKVTFISERLTDKTSSGKGNNDSPFVDSYRITGLQQGVLERQNQ